MSRLVGQKLDDLVVVIPGILGSQLARVDADGKYHEIWGTGAATLMKNLLTFGHRIRRLSLEPQDDPDAPSDRIVATGLIKDFQLIPGFIRIAGYDSLIDRLRRDNGLTADQVLEYPYDWRLSNRINGRNLARFLDEQVSRWRTKNRRSDLRAVLVCHSMGGLVARWCVEVEKGYELVSRTITIGTPYKGAGIALDALANGVRLPRHLGLNFDTLVRSLPSVRELLPTYACVRSGDTVKHLNEINVLPAAWVAEGFQFHQRLAEALNNRDPSRTDTLDAFRGCLQPTIASASLSADGNLTMHESSDGTEDGQDDRGDGTVPRDSATPPEWPHAGHAKAVAQRHSSMQMATSVRDELNAMLTDGPRLMSGRAQLGLRLPDTVVAGQPFDVTVSGRTGLRLAAEIRSIDGSAEPQSITAMWDDDDDIYRIHVGPLEIGGHQIRIIEGNVSSAPVDEVSDVVLAYPASNHGGQ